MRTDEMSPGAPVPDGADEHAAAGAVGAHRPWYRRLRYVLVLVLVVLVGGCAAVVGMLWSDRGADPVPVGEAVREFRDRDRDGAGAPAAVLSPAAGVYAFSADGTERLSLLGTGRDWGAVVPATVTRAGECWSLHVDYSTDHSQGWDFCPDGPVLTEVGGRTFQRFDFVAFSVDDETVFTCDPPGAVLRIEARPGDSWSQSCSGASTSRGSSTVSAGANTFVGEEDVVVGGETVATYHYRQQRTISGDQEGGETTDLWFSQADALVVRMQRDVDVKSPSPIGDVRYTERGTLVLQSLHPQR